MSVQSSPDTRDLASKLEAHAEETARLHTELRTRSSTLGPEKAAALNAAVDAHERAYGLFNGDAQAVVGPTHR